MAEAKQLDDVYLPEMVKEDPSITLEVLKLDPQTRRLLTNIKEFEKYLRELERKMLRIFLRPIGFAFPLAIHFGNEYFVGVLTCRHLFFDREHKSKEEQQPNIETDSDIRFFRANSVFQETFDFEIKLSSAIISKRDTDSESGQDMGLDFAFFPIPKEFHTKISFYKASSQEEVKAMKNKKECAGVPNLQIPNGLFMLQDNKGGSPRNDDEDQMKIKGFIVERNFKEAKLEHDIEGIQGMSGIPIFSHCEQQPVHMPSDDQISGESVKLGPVKLVAMIDHFNEKRDKTSCQMNYFGKLIFAIQKDIKRYITEATRTEDDTAKGFNIAGILMLPKNKKLKNETSGKYNPFAAIPPFRYSDTPNIKVPKMIDTPNIESSPLWIVGGPVRHMRAMDHLVSRITGLENVTETIPALKESLEASKRREEVLKKENDGLRLRVTDLEDRMNRMEATVGLPNIPDNPPQVENPNNNAQSDPDISSGSGLDIK